jgi:hypothetical protein
MDSKAMRRTFMTCWLIAAGIPAAGCQPKDAAPVPGKVSLQFLAMSAGDAEFQLSNGTSKAIGIVAASSLVPGFDYSILCDGATMNQLPSEQHGWAERDVVLPGQSMRVFFRGGFEKGSRCAIQLKLKSGATIDSTEFVP